MAGRSTRRSPRCRGAGRRPRGHRGLHDARQHAHQGAAGPRRRSTPISGRSLDDRARGCGVGAWRSPTSRPSDLDAAEAGFERVLQLNPRSTKALWQLADIWMRRGEFARGRAALSSRARSTSIAPAFLVKLGESHIELAQYDEAEKACARRSRLKPTRPMAHYDLGVLHEARGDRPGRGGVRGRAESAPEAVPAALQPGEAAVAHGRAKDAARTSARRWRRSPSFGSGYLYLAKALLDTGDLTGAEAAALKGLASEAAPDVRPLGHYVLADVYSRLGRERDAARQVAIGRRLERGGDVIRAAGEVLALGLAALAPGCSRADAPGTQPRRRAASSVLIVTIDTLRADRLGVYGARTSRRRTSIAWRARAPGRATRRCTCR